ncbi:MAG: ABC transporter permease [Roseitalea sp.]|jgi:peptide/nickel transport system permease protein|uniref:ABC transporter permease n=1 Tax=Oceaniradius stylonematis TaxID=2184161 RepID=UPI001B044233|nr:ABC transporter permease [Roseitalea sp.]MBO6950456.1 ABC transporter permease [Rhizobiaceae bacterium]MBO6591556.1 ABC transporter permease [Roseitalea sp.]MBO6599411.1 ABC transporter permease [Roseitalea sp.]MBO6612100.1 ABC transporter permease [Roseitalea sp.]
MRTAISTLRLLSQALLIILAVSLINFALVRLAPGDPASVLAGQSGAADELYLAQLREQFGLDQPILVQLGKYYLQLLQFDLGYSYRQQLPVVDLIAERLPNTLLLTLSAFAIALILGVAFGVAAALNRDNWIDTAVGTAAMVLYASPVFFTGLMLILVFSVFLGWFPAFGSETIGADYGFIGQVADRLKYLVLPAVTLSLLYAATYTRLTRTAMLDVLQMDYVKLARAKGLPPFRIVGAHVLRNALLPVITIAGMQAGHLVGGAVVVETVFAWPGIGRLAFDALLQRDYPVLMGVFLISSIMVVFFNIITDLAYKVFDPTMEVS